LQQFDQALFKSIFLVLGNDISLNFQSSISIRQDMAQFAQEEAPLAERWGKDNHAHYCCFKGCTKGGMKGLFVDSDGIERRLRLCSRCKDVVYCSTEHQKADWKLHKPKCKESANINTVAPTNAESYESFKDRNVKNLICISQSMLFGDLIRTHVLWMQVKEIGGGAVAIQTPPIIMSLEELAGMCICMCINM
jgi:hypothetical protein